jgi:hypothetical protein
MLLPSPLTFLLSLLRSRTIIACLADVDEPAEDKAEADNGERLEEVVVVSTGTSAAERVAKEVWDVQIIRQIVFSQLLLSSNLLTPPSCPVDRVVLRLHACPGGTCSSRTCAHAYSSSTRYRLLPSRRRRGNTSVTFLPACLVMLDLALRLLASHLFAHPALEKLVSHLPPAPKPRPGALLLLLCFRQRMPVLVHHDFIVVHVVVREEERDGLDVPCNDCLVQRAEVQPDQTQGHGQV